MKRHLWRTISLPFSQVNHHSSSGLSPPHNLDRHNVQICADDTTCDSNASVAKEFFQMEMMRVLPWLDRLTRMT